MNYLLQVYSVDGEVHPGIGEGKRGVIGALSDDKHLRVLRFLDVFREHGGTLFKPWIYPYYVAIFNKVSMKKSKTVREIYKKNLIF